MKFIINNAEWIVRIVNEDEMNNEMKNDYTLGVTIYKTQEILLLKNQPNILKTLKHELTHVWLYEYGHAQNDDSNYKYEDVCEIVASSNNFINKIIKKFKKSKDIEISNLFSDEEIENIIQKSKKEMEENYDKKMD